jgi:hypothetical protein
VKRHHLEAAIATCPNITTFVQEASIVSAGRTIEYTNLHGAQLSRHVTVDCYMSLHRELEEPDTSRRVWDQKCENTTGWLDPMHETRQIYLRLEQHPPLEPRAQSRNDLPNHMLEMIKPNKLDSDVYALSLEDRDCTIEAEHLITLLASRYQAEAARIITRLHVTGMWSVSFGSIKEILLLVKHGIVELTLKAGEYWSGLDNWSDRDLMRTSELALVVETIHRHNTGLTSLGLTIGIRLSDAIDLDMPDLRAKWGGGRLQSIDVQIIPVDPVHLQRDILEHNHWNDSFGYRLRIACSLAYIAAPSCKISCWESQNNEEEYGEYPVGEDMQAIMQYLLT